MCSCMKQRYMIWILQATWLPAFCWKIICFSLKCNFKKSPFSSTFHVSSHVKMLPCISLMNPSDLAWEVCDTFLVVVCFVFTVAVKYAAQWGRQRRQLASCGTADEISLFFSAGRFGMWNQQWIRIITKMAICWENKWQKGFSSFPISLNS